MMMKLPGSKNASYNEKVEAYNNLVQRMDKFKKRGFLYRWIFHSRYQSMRIELASMLKQGYWPLSD